MEGSLLLCIFAAIYATSEQATIEVIIHASAISIQSEIKEITELWTDYLNAFFKYTD